MKSMWTQTLEDINVLMLQNMCNINTLIFSSLWISWNILNILSFWKLKSIWTQKLENINALMQINALTFSSLWIPQNMQHSFLLLCSALNLLLSLSLQDFMYTRGMDRKSTSHRSVLEVVDHLSLKTQLVDMLLLACLYWAFIWPLFYFRK